MGRSSITNLPTEFYVVVPVTVYHYTDGAVTITANISGPRNWYISRTQKPSKFLTTSEKECTESGNYLSVYI